MKYTKFTAVKAIYGGEGLKLSKGADYTLANKEKRAFAVGCEMTAASKTLTLDIDTEQVMLVKNTGATNAFTLKIKSGDTGVSLAAGGVAIVAGGQII